MDIYVSTYDGSKVDLDDMGVHSDKWKEMDAHDLFLECMKEAGSSLFYMNFLHPNFGEGGQQERVDILCKELVQLWDDARILPIDMEQYNIYLLKWMYRFQDEVENQC
jgi:hypothetical protein